MKKIVLLLSVIFFVSGCSSNHAVEKNRNIVEEGKNKQETTITETDQSNSESNVAQEMEEENSVPVVFNETEVIGDQMVITNTDNVMILVNKKFALPSDYTPKDLVRPNVDFSFGDQDIEKSYMRKEAARALEALFQEAKQEGLSLFAVSGYRSYIRQEQIFQYEVDEKGEERAIEAVAYPGHSEHQTGLAMDLTSPAVDYLLTEQFEQTNEGKWLKENAYRFGFILRYPKGKEDITGYEYEPWHFRYVGEQVAEVIYQKGWTLEEFFLNAK
ncbi:M15 family metallopeptidase [Fervidibacillus halotolerans]|uniref:M15 family metallopeptidase n=1 Tax=Fervidibacillus halotolerans TaxID=2980027 RepID=A0A9E8RZM3_9BACI|nr:M15 family metallopeptidase [Fervidibacillus halotolerans]WAA13289.1 M15 family metallopeptidase [Fervidibacillus halotolerans]